LKQREVIAGGSSPRGRTVFTVEEKKGKKAFRKDTSYKIHI
jgi:hypothetical protein